MFSFFYLKNKNKTKKTFDLMKLTRVVFSIYSAPHPIVLSFRFFRFFFVFFFATCLCPAHKWTSRVPTSWAGRFYIPGRILPDSYYNKLCFYYSLSLILFCFFFLLLLLTVYYYYYNILWLSVCVCVCALITLSRTGKQQQQRKCLEKKERDKQGLILSLLL